MPTPITFASAAARAFGFTATSKKLVSQTFTSSQSWVVPAGVTTLASVSGKGGPGQAPSVQGITWTIVAVNFISSGTFGGGTFDWSSPYSYGQGVAADMNADGAASWTEYHFDVWPDQTNNQTAAISRSDGGNIPGTFSVSGPSSGPATSSDSITISGDYNDSGAYGTAATAFGLTFPGGTPSVPAASVTTFTSVAVTSGASYPLSIPSGGSITVSYYQ